MNFGPAASTPLLLSGLTYGVVFALLAVPAFHYRGHRGLWGTWGLFTAVHVVAWMAVVWRAVPPAMGHRPAILAYVAAVIALQVGVPLAAGAAVLPRIATGRPPRGQVARQGLGVIVTVAAATPACWVLWGRVLPWIAERTGWLPVAGPLHTA